MINTLSISLNVNRYYVPYYNVPLTIDTSTSNFINNRVSSLRFSYMIFSSSSRKLRYHE